MYSVRAGMDARRGVRRNGSLGRRRSSLVAHSKGYAMTHFASPVFAPSASRLRTRALLAAAALLLLVIAASRIAIAGGLG